METLISYAILLIVCEAIWFWPDRARREGLDKP